MYQRITEYQFTQLLVMAVVICGGVSILGGTYYLFDYFGSSTYSRVDSSLTLGILGVGAGVPTILAGVVSNVIIDIARNTESSAKASMQLLEKIGHLEGKLDKLNEK